MKIKIKKVFAIAAAALGLGFAASARAAGTGDVWAIVPCDQYGNIVDAYASATSPLEVSTPLYFKICLQNPFYYESEAGVAYYKPWKRTLTGIYEGITDEATITELLANEANKPKVGIFAGGSTEYTWATMADYQPSTDFTDPFTEIIFTYTVQPGDFAFPIRIATKGSAKIVPEGYAGCGNEFLVESGVCEYRPLTTAGTENDPAIWQFSTEERTNPYGDDFDAGDLWYSKARTLGYSESGNYGETGDFETKCGFYVKTVDFDSTWYNETYWRSVHAGSTQVVGIDPVQVVAKIAPSPTATLYVWSDNENAVRLAGSKATQREITVDASGTKETRWIATLEVNTETETFTIEGVTEGATANLVLSTWPDYNYDNEATGSLVVDYITVPVYCDEPLPRSVTVTGDTTIYATSDRYTAAETPIRVTLTSPSTEVITLKVVPSIDNWKDYVFFSANSTATAIPESGIEGSTALSFTIPAGQTVSTEAYYIFALGTENNATTFNLNPTDISDAEISDNGRWYALGVTIKAKSTAALEEEIKPTRSVPVAIKISVLDTYNDEAAGKMTGGYTLYVRTDAADEDSEIEVANLYLVNGVLSTSATQETPPEITFENVLHTTSSFRVQSPVSNAYTDWVEFTHKIYTKDVTAKVDDGASYTEGSTLGFTISNPSSETALYAFLVCKSGEDVTVDKFQETFVVCDQTDTTRTGIRIEPGAVETAATLTVLDNFTGKFEIVLCETENWSVDSIYGAFPATEITPTPLAIANVSAKIAGSVTMYKPGVIDDLDHIASYEQAISRGVPQGSTRAFHVYANDFAYDLNNVDAEGNGTFITRWVLKNPDGDVIDESRKLGNPNIDSADSFYITPELSNVNGVYTLTVQVVDKDDYAAFVAAAALQGWTTEAQIWKYIDDQNLIALSATRTVELSVKAKPGVTITPSTYSIYENDSSAYLTIALSDWDTYSTVESLKVRVEITKQASTTDGCLELAVEKNAELTTDDVDVYDLEFTSANMSQGIYYNMDTLDGTATTSNTANNYGFMVTASVVSEDVLPSSDQKACDYYTEGKLTRPLKVYNVAPNISKMGESNDQGLNNTNTLQVTGGNTPAIKWYIKESLADLKGENTIDDQNPGTGVHVVITASVPLLNKKDEIDFYVKDGDKLSGSFTPNFGSYQGKATVTFTFTDKEGDEYDGEVEWVSLPYEIPAAKYLTIAANGPSRGNSTMDLSQWYAAATGRGAGHTYVYGSGITFWNAINFNLQWNCGSNTKVTAYAAGYKVGDYDDGNLNDFDIGLSTKGSRSINDATDAYKKEDGTAYSYATFDESRDSFFYGWIYADASGGNSDDSSSSSTYIIRVAPEMGENIVSGTLDLPTAKTEDESGYPETYVEAVFSRERYAGDNLGDINFDGIPDYFALRKKYGSGTTASALIAVDNLGGELAEVAGLNDDEDFYPSRTALGQGDGFIPNAVSGWSTSGQAFTALLELRGYHTGLNYGMFQASVSTGDTDGWISDLDLSAGEKLALVRAALASKNGTKWAGAATQAEALLATLDEPESATAETVALWLDNRDDADAFANQQALAKAFIDATWRTATGGDWGFTVENRTDPKLADSDGDGLSDGYEFYFWYASTVGFEKDGTALDPIAGSRFNVEDMETPTPITSEEIASLFNPNVNRDWTNQDTDNDGIYDLEEVLIGTSPVNWDTDGDGLSDYYEVMYGMNPLNSDIGSSFNADGDFMAVAEMRGAYYIIPYSVDDNVYYAFENISVEQSEGVKTVTGSAFAVGAFNGGYTPLTLNVTTNIATEVSITTTADISFALEKVQLYHHQVYQYFGFDPRTAWYSGSNGLSLTTRWKPQETLLEGGTPQNTAEFTARDEFLLMKFRKLTGLNYRVPKSGAVADYINLNCTNPNATFEAVTWGDSETVYEGEYHGADSDGDKVPDGWELYIGVDPNISYTLDKGDPSHDPLYWDDGKYADGSARPAIGGNIAYLDGLDLATEYAGTDSSGVYEGCETVYSNYPGADTSSIPDWFNKLFPTDPRNTDTDGDGIGDGDERSDWGETMVFGRWGQNEHDTTGIVVRHKSIYGNPSDSGSICTRGGGYNPCSIDTDGDALPDLWERQYAGVLFKGMEPYIEEPDGSKLLTIATGAGSLTQEVYDDFRAAADAFYRIGDTNDLEEVYQILMGMDGTVQDAGSGTGVSSYDYDWDGDGLENWQEYLVQAMRHFRYDDSKTPLLGRDIPATDSVEGVVPGAWLGGNEPGKGFLRVSYTTPFTVAELDKIEEIGYKNFAAFARENPDYLATLGYFADPPKAWDHAKVDLNYTYMLPPSCYRDTLAQASSLVQATDDEGRLLWTYEGGAKTNYFDEVVETIYDGGTVYTTQVYIEDIDATYDVTIEPVMVENSENYKVSTTIVKGGKYVSSDPRLWDTDQDGMDDYYELFHGLNPILGSAGTVMGDSERDIIARSGLGASAWSNAWIGWDNQEAPAFDPIKYPWLMGTAEADPDGDSLRNCEECLLADITSPNTSHTDPTPLWMTDATVPYEEFESVVTTQTEVPRVNALGNPIYTWDAEQGKYVEMTDIVTTTKTNKTNIVLYKSPSYTALYYPFELANDFNRSVVAKWNFDTSATFFASFEQNEGYDTDNDWRTDSGEVKSLMRKNSDPLNFNDPTRRQSVWFGGKDDPGVAISYMPAERRTHGSDFFRQFTVEAWIKPADPANGQDQYIVSRACNYGPWDLDSWDNIVANSNSLVRMNFALGIDAYGNIFAETQNSTEYSSRATGNSAKAGEWVHVAATYDGAKLVLYRNGLVESQAETTIIPATGVDIVEQDPQYTGGFPYSDYRSVPSITILGGRAVGPGAFGYDQAPEVTSWDQVATDFFKGSVAEVRTWDGARTVSQMASAYNTRYTVDDLKDMRDAIFAKYNEGATRSNGELPAELIQYYNFNTLPGAVEGEDVRVEPASFAIDVFGEAKNPETGAALDDLLAVGWWSGIVTNETIGSKVYTSKNVVPWMENMVSHLPSLSGNVPDSFYWTENFAWVTPASFHGIASYSFPNTLNPYNVVGEGASELNFARKYFVLMNIDSNYRWFYSQYRHDYDYGLTGISDLIPLGSTFAKRNTDNWDGQGAESAWQETGVDADRDDLPDWWEEYAESEYGVSDIDANTEVVRNGATMTAYEAYLRDLAAGLLPGADSAQVAYVNREDFNKDGLPDWWSDIYGVANGANGDDDNDGLSNYTEYLLSEVFTLGVTFSPVKAYSVSQYNTDYFYRVGQMYIGEIFADHDFIEDVWEDKQGSAYSSRYEWNGNSDYDEDGWTNFAERRYSQFTANILAKNVSHIVSDTEDKDMPIPTLKLTLRYNGNQPLKATSSSSSSSSSSTDENALAPLVVQTFTRDGIIVPDATYNVTPGATTSYRKYLGAWESRVFRGTLSPGYLQINSIELQSMKISDADTYLWQIYNSTNYHGTGKVKIRNSDGSAIVMGSYAQFLSDLAIYSGNIALVNDDSDWGKLNPFAVMQKADSEEGYLTVSGTRIGTINMRTGEFALDFSFIEGGGLSMNNTNSTTSTYAAQSSVWRIVYDSKMPVLQDNKVQLYLGEPNTGYVKEGKNTIVAFYDLDGDGKYTVGEPMGTAIVDVGWHQGEAEIELTDTTPIITRCDLVSAVSDRLTRYGTESGDDAEVLQEGSLSGGKVERIRVIRTLVNNWGVQDKGIENRVVLDKEIDLDQRTYFYEGDILEDGEFDIDWKNFSEIGDNAGDPTEVAYRIVLGNGDISADGTNNLYSIVTTRHFDSSARRTRPVEVAPGSQSSGVYGSRPVFKWTMKVTDSTTGNEYDNNSYTAFKVQVRDGSSLVYDSGIRRAPARDLNGVYTFVPDVYAGDLLAPDKNYTWRVSMYNAKFQSDAWSTDGSTFRMNTISNSLEYGSIKVAAKYFGPDVVLSGGTVRIEAYDTPDFTGSPVARTYVRTKSTVSDKESAHTANATLIGLPKGTYYVRGYIDMSMSATNEYRYAYKKDNWESWGYVSARDGSSPEMFAPTAIVIGNEAGEGEVFDLYIEDVDTNGNNLPDAWEMQTNGKLDKGTERIDDTLNSGIAIRYDITDNLNTLEQTSSVAGLSAYAFSVVKNSGVAALMLDADVSNYSSYTAAAAAAATGVTTSTSLKTLKITAIDVAEDGKVKVETEATGRKSQINVSTAAMSMYEKPGSSVEPADTVTKKGRLYYTYDLTEDWVASIEVDINVNTDGTATVTPFDIPEEITSGHDKTFFKIMSED